MTTQLLRNLQWRRAWHLQDDYTYGSNIGILSHNLLSFCSHLWVWVLLFEASENNASSSSIWQPFWTWRWLSHHITSLLLSSKLTLAKFSNHSSRDFQTSYHLDQTPLDMFKAQKCHFFGLQYPEYFSPILGMCQLVHMLLKLCWPGQTTRLQTGSDLNRRDWYQTVIDGDPL